MRQHDVWIDKESVVMPSTHVSTYFKNPAFVPRRLQRDWVFIPIEEPLSTYKELLVIDEMGKFLYDLCDGNNSVEQIVESVVERFDISAEVAKNDVNYFLSLLEQGQILLPTVRAAPQLTHLGEQVKELKISDRLPLSASFEITGKCNLRCIHCYVAGERTKQELKTEQIFSYN
jgi:sulfatase maturation enzyme AslB (radical SAM superfamily)